MTCAFTCMHISSAHPLTPPLNTHTHIHTCTTHTNMNTPIPMSMHYTHRHKCILILHTHHSHPHMNTSYTHTHTHTHTHIHSPPPPTPQKDNRKSCCFNTKTTNHTHIDTKVLGEPSASGPQHTKGQALVQHDAHLVLQLQLQLPTQTNPPTVLDDSVPNFTSCFS